MKIQEVRELIRLIDQSTIEEFEYESNGTSVKMKKNGTSIVLDRKPIVEEIVQGTEVSTQPVRVLEVIKNVVQEIKEPVLEANVLKVTSPMVGTFYSSPTPDSKAYVSIGDRVGDDTVVCIVEAMKLFNEIEAEVVGEVVEVLVRDGQLVEYGQPLFLVKA